MADWIKAANLDVIPVAGSVVLKLGESRIAVVRNRDNRVFAVNNECPHKGGALSEGIVHSNFVTCPLHNWVINLEDGQVEGPDEGQVACYETKVDNGMVYILPKKTRHMASDQN